ncbi:MAG: M28 family peptidase [Acidilobaceae archaeon]
MGSPVDLPLVVVEEGYASKLEGAVYIEIEAEVQESSSAVVEAELGEGEELVMIGAHIDRWFKGALDNVLGIAQAVATARLLSEKGFRVRLVLFGSEEFGVPGYASWYWAWGSRFYAEQLMASGVWKEVKLYVNFDTAGFDPLLISGSPQYVGNSEIQERCCESPETDSFSFAVIGVPTISFHSMWSKSFKEIYHTPRDSIEAVNFDIATQAVVEAVKVISKEPNYLHIEKKVLAPLLEGPLEARRIAYVISSIASRVGWKELYPELARRFLKPVLYDYGCRKETDLEAVWFSEVVAYLRVLRELREERNPPEEVWVSGEERPLYKIKGERSARSLAEQARAHMKRLWLEVEEIQKELLK